MSKKWVGRCWNTEAHHNSKECECLVDTTYTKNIGMLFMRQQSTVSGLFCRKCVRELFAEYLCTNLFLGWWGGVSFIINPFLIVSNIIFYIRAEVGLSRGVIAGYDFTVTQQELRAQGRDLEISTNP